MEVGISYPDNPSQASDSFMTAEQIKAGGFVFYVVMVLYLFAALSILKARYLFPILEDICEVYSEKKMYFMKSLSYLFFNVLDIWAFMVFATSGS